MDWLKIKAKTGKRDGSTYEDERIFSWGLFTSRDMWNRAIAKVGIDYKDEKTGRRIYHLHSLRKFFRTKIGLDLDITNALMGHVEYLDDAYLRQDQEEIAHAYLDAMGNVSVHQVEDQELKQNTAILREENEELRVRIERLEAMLRIPWDPRSPVSREEIERIYEQQQTIIRALEKQGLVTRFKEK